MKEFPERPSSLSHPADMLLRKLEIKNYRSINRLAIDLGRLTILVGRNGAGKSNVLDALAFITDSLQGTLDHAIKSRGGMDAVRRRSTGHPHNFAFTLSLQLNEKITASYGFELTSKRSGRFSVKEEYAKIFDFDGTVLDEYKVRDGSVKGETSSSINMPVAAADRLYLVAASNVRSFRLLYDALTSMGFYNLNPDQMSELQSPDAGELLHRDGRNIASVIARLATEEPGCSPESNPIYPALYRESLRSSEPS